MRSLNVSIEINGQTTFAGNIHGEGSEDSSFQYSTTYLDNPDAVPISISLPLQVEPFTAAQTRNYFEGLLPEGFLKMTVAQRMRTDESDYLSILASLGRECLGAIMVTDENDIYTTPRYERLSMEQIRELAREGVTKSVQLVTKAHLSLAGASGKVGLYYNPDEFAWYVPMGNAPSTHIVKQSHVRLDAIVANEQLALTTAGMLGIEVPESHIINTGNAGEDEVLFATRRYDRVLDPERDNTISGLKAPTRLHQEDFAQAMGIASINKYESAGHNHMKGMFDIVRRHSSNPIEDMLKLWDIIVFDYLVGNTDNHIKNLSLVYNENLKVIRLAPAYDIISTAIYDSSTRDMAFHIGDEYNLDKITRNSFKLAARECGLGEKIAMNHFDRMKEGFTAALDKAANILTEQGFEKAEELRGKILELRKWE